ncbi:MAG: hypothetical protein AAGA93_16055 [Actinomycetota bacterium]
MQESESAVRAALGRPAIVFAVTWLIHTADHVRRGTATTPDGVIWGGTLVAVLAAVALTLIAVGHPIAPMAAALVFPAIAVGVAASHLLPEWGWLSEPLLIEPVADRFAAAAASLEILGAAYLGWSGLRVVRANGYRLLVTDRAGGADPAGA